MATTTNFGWETPDDTDLVKDGALAMRTLGNAIDTSLVDLKGGTTGQNLRKNSNTDMDFVWAGDATNTVVDAAGDLLVGTAADTLGRLGIGTAGQVLKVNSGATALEWGSASAAGFVGASAYKTTGQTISNNTQTAITWSAEYFDTDAFHSTSTNTSRFTIPAGKGGKYLFTATARFASNSTGIRSWTYYKNGSGLMQPAAMNAVSSGGSATSVVWVGDLIAGDYIELYCFQTSGGNLDILADADNTYITISYLGA